MANLLIQNAQIGSFELFNHVFWIVRKHPYETELYINAKLNFWIMIGVYWPLYIDKGHQLPVSACWIHLNAYLWADHSASDQVKLNHSPI